MQAHRQPIHQRSRKKKSKEPAASKSFAALEKESTTQHLLVWNEYVTATEKKSVFDESDKAEIECIVVVVVVVKKKIKLCSSN
jgi:hypothetical protein